MNFNVIEGNYADMDNIHDDFVQDYIFSTKLSNNEIRVKYHLTHSEFKELSDSVKKEYGLSRRHTQLDSAKYYYPQGNFFKIQKRIMGEEFYIGVVPFEWVAIKVVELCKKIEWDIDECKKICKNWKAYVG